MRVNLQLLLIGLYGAVARAIEPSSTMSPAPTVDHITLPEVFPTPITDIQPSIFSCWTSHVSWSLSSSSIYYAPEASKTLVTFSSLVTTIIGDYTIFRPSPDTTLCDGYPRVTGQATPTGSAPTSVATMDTTWVSTWIPPSPTCTVDSYGSICRRLHASMTSILSSTEQSTSTLPAYILRPPCRTPDTYPSPSAKITCSLDAGQLTYKALYWPISTTGDFCASPHLTILPTPTIIGKPNTAVYEGLTMTSPTVYYLLENMQMRTFAGLVNYNRALTFLPLQHASIPPLTLSQNPIATPISSALINCNLGRQCFTTLHPFALEDLATVPGDTYYKLIGGNDRLYQGWYTPAYTLPTGWTTAGIGKGWEICETMTTGVMKPKFIALPTKQVEVGK